MIPAHPRVGRRIGQPAWNVGTSVQQGESKAARFCRWYKTTSQFPRDSRPADRRDRESRKRHFPGGLNGLACEKLVNACRSGGNVRQPRRRGPSQDGALLVFTKVGVPQRPGWSTTRKSSAAGATYGQATSG